MPLTTLAIDASRMNARARTGTENYSVEIVRSLSALDDCPALTLYARNNVETVPIPNATTKRSGPGRLWTHLGLSRAMLRDRPDALFVPAHVVPLIHPAATVVTVHDLGYLAEPEAHPGRRRVMLDQTTRWNARTARRIIAISEQTRNGLVRHYRIAPERITVIPHGVDHVRFHPARDSQVETVLERHGVERPYLLFVSTIQPRKNISRLLEAFERLECRDLSLVIAGAAGWLSEPIEERIRSSSSRLAGRIQRLGYVPDGDLPALYSGAEAFVFPSLFEGFGMGVLEAMASGTPVVTSNAGSLAEVAGDAAVLVDPRSVESIVLGIERALLPDVAASLRERGLERAREFTWQASARRTLDVIRAAHDDA